MRQNERKIALLYDHFTTEPFSKYPSTDEEKVDFFKALTYPSDCSCKPFEPA